MEDTFDIILNVRGSHIEDGEEDALELLTEGRLTKQGTGRYTIEYLETETPGVPSTTMRVSVDGDSIGMRRIGGNDTDFVFQKSQRQEASYMTPAGPVSVMVLPTHIASEERPGRGSIGLEYVVEYGDASALNRLYIDYRFKN